MNVGEGVILEPMLSENNLVQYSEGKLDTLIKILYRA